jgi:hypothetical protein
MSPLFTPPQEEASQEARTAHSQALEACSELLQSKGFAWFIETAIGGAQAELDGILRSPASEDRARDRAASVYDALEQLKAFVPDRHRQALNFIQGQS